MSRVGLSKQLPSG